MPLLGTCISAADANAHAGITSLRPGIFTLPLSLRGFKKLRIASIQCTQHQHSSCDFARDMLIASSAVLKIGCHSAS